MNHYSESSILSEARFSARALDLLNSSPARRLCGGDPFRESDTTRGSGADLFSRGSHPNNGAAVASMFDEEKALGFVAVTRRKRTAVALARGPSTDLAGGLSAADLLLSIIVIHDDRHQRWQY